MCKCPGFVYSPRFAQYVSNIRGLFSQSIDYCAKWISSVCASRSWDGAKAHFAHNIYRHVYHTMQINTIASCLYMHTYSLELPLTNSISVKENVLRFYSMVSVIENFHHALGHFLRVGDYFLYEICIQCSPYKQ